MEEDRVSNVADDILLLILSNLELKDAVRSSIVFRNWRYLVGNLTNLDFNGKEIMVAYRRNFKPLAGEKPRFVNWVNQVVSLHSAPSINEFRVCFELDKTHTDHIDAWVKFAISRGVKYLKLDFPYVGYCSGDNPRYTLRFHVVEACLGAGFSFLRCLYLRRVNICGELLESLLSRCHILERLFVEDSKEIVNLKVTNNSRLKYLEISRCSNMKQLELHAHNLLSFELIQYNHANVLYASVPSLVEASFGGSFCNNLSHNFHQIKHFSAHLSRLRLQMDMIDEDVIIPSFDNIKQLELYVYFHHDCGRSILALARLMEACPLLQECKLLMIRYDKSERDIKFEKMWEKMWEEAEFGSELEMDLNLDSYSDLNIEDVKHWINEVDRCSGSGTLPCLRKLEWIGAFSGYTDQDFSLALYIIKNAFQLEKFICDSADPILAEITPFAFKDDMVHTEFLPQVDDDETQMQDRVQMEIRKRRAKKLAAVIPSRVELIII